VLAAGSETDVMDDGEQLSALIGRIYDAGLDCRLWADVFPRIEDFVSGKANALPQDPENSGPGLGQRHRRQVLATHSGLSPVQRLPSCDDDATVGALPRHDECHRTGSRQWLKQPNLGDRDKAGPEETVTRRPFREADGDRAQNVVDAAMRRRLALVVPHVRRAVLIGKMIDRRLAEAAMFAGAVDGIGAGIFLLGAGAHIAHANAAAHALLRAADLLRTVSGRLIAANTTTDRSLREALTAAGGPDERGAIKGVALPMTALDGECYVGHLLPLSAGKRGSVSLGTVAALFVRKAVLAAPSRPEIIAKTYKLTPTELRVLLAIVEVGGVPEVAATLGIAQTTVKSHLARVFEKTATSRQADLVKLVAGFSSPLASG
jgi:DNA-binding CsgD family transcriptional regulator